MQLDSVQTSVIASTLIGGVVAYAAYRLIQDKLFQIPEIILEQVESAFAKQILMGLNSVRTKMNTFVDDVTDPNFAKNALQQATGWHMFDNWFEDKVNDIPTANEGHPSLQGGGAELDPSLVNNADASEDDKKEVGAAADSKSKSPHCSKEERRQNYC